MLIYFTPFEKHLNIDYLGVWSSSAGEIEAAPTAFFSSENYDNVPFYLPREIYVVHVSPFN